MGLGAPLTVTVGASGIAVGCPAFAGEDAGRTVNRGDVACMTPCVEFMKIRK